MTATEHHNAKPLQIIEPLEKAWQIANAIAIAVLEGARIDMINPPVLPPCCCHACDSIIDSRCSGSFYLITTGETVSSIQRAIAVMRASLCCWPISCTPTGMPLTLSRGMVTAGAKSIELG